MILWAELLGLMGCRGDIMKGGGVVRVWCEEGGVVRVWCEGVWCEGGCD